MTSKSNAEKQNGKGTPVMEITKNAKTAKKVNSRVEELQKQVNQLTAKLQAVPQDLNSRIEYFNNKKELIRKLTKLQGNAANLQEHLDILAELSAANDFDNENYILTIEGGEKYSRKQVFALQNPVLIAEVTSYLLGKVEAKTDELRKQIEA